jgi:hypothetical protein
MKKDDLRKLDLREWPIPDEFLIEFGRISAVWTSLEWMLEIYIGKLAGFNDLGDTKPFIFLKHTTFPQKLDILGALCSELVDTSPNLKGYEEVISQLRAAQKCRNKYIHNLVEVNPETKKTTLLVGSARGSVKTALHEIDILDVRAASIDIHDAMRSLHRLITGKDLPSVVETRIQRAL